MSRFTCVLFLCLVSFMAVNAHFETLLNAFHFDQDPSPQISDCLYAVGDDCLSTSLACPGPSVENECPQCSTSDFAVGGSSCVSSAGNPISSQTIQENGAKWQTEAANGALSLQYGGVGDTDGAAGRGATILTMDGSLTPPGFTGEPELDASPGTNGQPNDTAGLGNYALTQNNGQGLLFRYIADFDMDVYIDLWNTGNVVTRTAISLQESRGTNNNPDPIYVYLDFSAFSSGSVSPNSVGALQFTLTPSESQGFGVPLDATIFLLAIPNTYICGHVYDYCEHGICNDYPGHSGLSGATVTLFENGVEHSSVVTRAAGSYCFIHLNFDSSYRVELTIPAPGGYQITECSDSISITVLQTAINNPNPIFDCGDSSEWENCADPSELCLVVDEDLEDLELELHATDCNADFALDLAGSSVPSGPGDKYYDCDNRFITGPSDDGVCCHTAGGGCDGAGGDTCIPDSPSLGSRVGNGAYHSPITPQTGDIAPPNAIYCYDEWTVDCPESGNPHSYEEYMRRGHATGVFDSNDVLSFSGGDQNLGAIGCGEPVPERPPVVTDYCDTLTTPTFVDNGCTTNSECSDTCTRTWSVQDTCEGRTFTITQSWQTGVDTPTLTSVPDDFLGSCADYWFGGGLGDVDIDPSISGSATCSNTCGGCDVFYSDSPASCNEACGQRTTFSFVRTWWAEEPCSGAATPSRDQEIGFACTPCFVELISGDITPQTCPDPCDDITCSCTDIEVVISECPIPDGYYLIPFNASFFSSASTLSMSAFALLSLVVFALAHLVFSF